MSTAVSATSRRPSAPRLITQAYARTRLGTTPSQGRTFPIDSGRSSSSTNRSPSRSMTGRGRNGAIAAVTPTAPAPGPPQACGVENVLWMLKWQTSNPASRARVMPRIPLAFAWSYEHRPPASWTTRTNSSIRGLKMPVSSGFVIRSAAVRSDTAARSASTSG